MKHKSKPETSPSPEKEWLAIVEETSVEVRTTVANCAEHHAAALADYFYEGMLKYPQASMFLDHDTVHDRLHGSMQRWLRQLFSVPSVDPEILVAHQRLVGEVHARIQLPMHLVARGARLLKHQFFYLLESHFEEAKKHRQAMLYVGQSMDLALELMSAAYSRSAEREVRSDEAYRLFSMGQNMAVERERQRSVLLEWSQETLFTLHRQLRPIALPRLATSEFGLWFTHKAAVVFEGAPEILAIQDNIFSIDNTLLPQLQSLPLSDDIANHLISELQTHIEGVKFQLSTLFERQLEVENGRDTLTRLLNRRFLPSVMNREIHLAKDKGSSFTLVMLDIDLFKRVNDEYGHEAGDLVLQQSAALVLNTVRNGDFVFRYGGEELLIMLVEVSHDVARRIAETLRLRFESNDFLISQGRTLKVTVSLGLAHFDGHPDPHHLIRKADQAMYEAKGTGRNKVCESA